MGSSSAGPGSARGALPAAEAAHGGTGHGSGHASSVGEALIVTAVTHSAAMAAGKNTVTRTQVTRNGFTSDTMLVRPPDRIRNQRKSSRITFTGECLTARPPMQGVIRLRRVSAPSARAECWISGALSNTKGLQRRGLEMGAAARLRGVVT